MNGKSRLVGVAAAVGVVAAVGLTLAPGLAEADRTVEIRVDRRGFHPGTVRAARGEPLTLVFLRTEERGCGTSVVIPAHDIRRDLPVGERVPITLTPRDGDRLSFSCGMGHMRGAIVVEENE